MKCYLNTFLKERNFASRIRGRFPFSSIGAQQEKGCAGWFSSYWVLTALLITSLGYILVKLVREEGNSVQKGDLKMTVGFIIFTLLWGQRESIAGLLKMSAWLVTLAMFFFALTYDGLCQIPGLIKFFPSWLPGLGIYRRRL